MIFHSLDFIAFFLVTLAAYWAMPMRAQNVLMVVASYVFYGWVHPWWPVLLFVTTFVDYWSARRMSEPAPGSRLPAPGSRLPAPGSRLPAPGSRFPAPGSRKNWLWISIVSNLGLLGFYKYFGFFADNIAAAGDALGWHVPDVTLRVLLPAGISFYTFQSMSYTIDVYRGHAPARTRFIDVAAFVSFFPHLVAGPIMRATNLLPQFEQPRQFSAAAARDATVLIVWGFFKKLVIADNVGVIANKVFALESPDFFVLWAGVFAFAIQIYADFSAYTDIARGVAKWYGFDLIRNFDHPYLATGPVDFWRRWNISLSTWFRDYVYIPLGGSRRGPWRNAANLLITFLVSGFWHGASWNYVIWGAYHGVLLVASRLRLRAGRASAGQVLSPVVPARGWWLFRVTGMFALTSVGWLIFRETDLAQLWRDLRLSPMASTALDRDAGRYLFLLTALYSLPLWIHDAWAEFGGPSLVTAVDAEEAEVHWRRVAMQAVMCGLMMAAVLTLRSSSSLNFIYFAF